MMKVYFDNAATTPVHPKVFEKMKPFLTEDFGNPSSAHSFGRKARVEIEEARETIADFINANPSEIYFTSGGTEANNFIINGIAKTESIESGRKKLITSKADHHCVIDTIQNLDNDGFTSYMLDVDSNTNIDPESLNSILDSNTSLVSIIHANNETGSINPVEKIRQITKQNYFHSDCVQSFGKLEIDVKKLGFDSICGSGHKINGPKGTGFAFVKSGTPLSSFIIGGSQERNRRGGTENVAGIAGFAEAVRIAKSEMLNTFESTKKLRNYFIEGLESIAKDSFKINGGNNVMPNILSITFLSNYYKNDAEAMLMFLDINSVAVSNGAACTSGTWKPSHVILSSGYSIQDAAGTIRFSFGSQNTHAEIDYTIGVLREMLTKFRR